MPKRFTATEKWQDRWFRRLPPGYKLLWLYMLDNCDNAGLWEHDLDLASMYTGCPYDERDVRKIFSERIHRVNGKWFIRKFVDFQYGELRRESKPHQSVITKLSKLGLLNGNGRVSIPLQKRSVTPKDKDKDKAKASEKDKGIY